MDDHYETLGLSSAATKDEIKNAYRRSALKFHPDRHSNSSPEARDAASRRFRLASQAYEVLSDPRRRADYDLARRSGWPSSPRPPSSQYGYGRSGGGGRGGGGGGYTYRRATSGAPGFDPANVFRYFTARRFLANFAFASALFVGAVVIEKSIEAIWNRNNSGSDIFLRSRNHAITRWFHQNMLLAGKHDEGMLQNVSPSWSGRPLRQQYTINERSHQQAAFRLALDAYAALMVRNCKYKSPCLDSGVGILFLSQFGSGSRTTCASINGENKTTWWFLKDNTTDGVQLLIWPKSLLEEMFSTAFAERTVTICHISWSPQAPAYVQVPASCQERRNGRSSSSLLPGDEKAEIVIVPPSTVAVQKESN